MIFNSVSQPITETGPDGETTVLPRLEWMYLWIDRVKAQELPEEVLDVAANLLGWEAEHTAWKREGQPVPALRRPRKPTGRSPEAA